MNETRVNSPRVIVALDYADSTPVLALADRLDPSLCRLKVGKELFTACGPGLVIELQKKGFDIFLDLKFHDIPNTVASAVRVAAGMGVWMVNVHASGGTAMLKAAADAVAGTKTLLIGVTVLTSLDDADLAAMGVRNTTGEQVLALATMCRDAGLDGVVCSSREASDLKQKFGENFLLVTPGIRPAGSASGDQKRIVTPSQAISNGSSYLVIGRPVTQADDPLARLVEINNEISGNP